MVTTGVVVKRKAVNGIQPQDIKKQLIDIFSQHVVEIERGRHCLVGPDFIYS